ncbi:uncharacterized protein LOC119793123 [Cyprinodon tularosa]|uniref:uncharacterized protein LOC119793123 n=1 Tax=Cyprinodon tularosa TaxID=77115 RepID=UPI0018E234B5|nr:uncharacterized protein LOC119793123 [Cyprinodon tularosa]
MAVHRPSFLAVVLLLASLDLWCSSSSPPCPKSCTCQRASLLNCSSSGLSSVPQFIQDSITELDLSHNLLSSATFDQPHPSLRSLWLGNNSIPYLSLCIETHVRGRHRRFQSETGSGSGCQTWAPALQLLSAERNLLEQLPEGLDTIKSLQIVQLSFNRISNLKPGILSDLHQLQELHLQHNFITHLHPKLFHNLDQLKVLDLSFNMLTNMQQLTYLTLRNIGADVKLSGNRWRCDCNARNLKRQMTYDSTRGLQAWNIICAFPSTVSGKDLLQLNEEDLKCLSSENKPNLHQDLTVYSGAEILLFCSEQESAWWTPSGLASVDQHEARLHIREFSEGDAGLYVCVSEEDQVLSVFNLQISETREARKVRSLPRAQNTSSKTAQTFTPGDLALGVCLSILFTFLLAFILGVLARPCIDRLWRRVSKKEARRETHTATSVQRGQYENHAFSNAEEREAEHHRERRVTFSSVEFTEESNVQYYDTVAHGNQESFRSSELSEYQEGVDMHKYRKDKQSDDSSSAEMAAERLRNMKFEHIPDPDELEERRSSSSSSSSNSSQNASEADQRTRDHTKPKSLQLVEESLKRADFSKTTKTKTQLNRSSSPQTNKTHQASSEDSQGDEEQFEFSDVAQSPSSNIGSVPVSFSSNVHQVKNSYDSKRPEETQDNSLSSDSSYSNKDATQTKIKQRTDKKRRKFALKSKPATHSSSSDSESGENISYVNVKSRTNTQQHSFQTSTTQVYNSDGTWPAVDLEHIPSLKRRLDIKALLKSSGSSSSSDSEYKIRGHMIKQKQEAMSELPVEVSPKVSSERESHWPPPDLRKTSFQKPLDIMTPSTDSNSSSASDSDDKRKYQMAKQKENELPILNVLAHRSKASQKQAKHWPKLDFGKVIRIKRRLDIKAPRAESESSSSSDSEDETRGYVMKQHEMVMSKLPAKDSPTLRPKFKKPLDTKAPLTDSDSSSASDSDDKTKYHMIKQKQEELPIVNVSANRSTASQNPDNQWPALDFGKVTKIKRHLDIKARRAHSDSSSSSDSEDETRQYVKTQKQEELVMSKLPTKVSPTMRPKPENRWPPPDLTKTELKKPLDTKAPLTDSDSSSASDSDDETKHHMTKQKQEELPILNVLANRSTESQKQANHWPALDFGKVTKIKRRLDIKAPRAHSDSSSSSDSEDETRQYVMTQKQEELVMSKLPTKVSPTWRPKPENRWPPPDLARTEFKKPLDTKAPLTDSDSSSASDSDDKTKYHMIKQKQEELPIVNVSANRSTASQNPDNQWPALDFGKVTKIKRHLDIKAPRAHSDSSSSSESEDETRQYVKTQKQEELVMSKLPTKVSPTMRPKPENRWPPPDLTKTELKKPLDTKAPLTDSDSSSASDSDDETKHHMTKQKQEELPILNVLANRSTESQKQANHWPALDFGKVTKIKRRLDIKATRAHSDSSSSSDSEDETRRYVMTQKQEELVISKLPTKVSPTWRPKPENRWPPPDLTKTELKKPLHTKAPLTDSDSSSASDSDDETKHHMTKQKQEELPILNVLANRSTESQKQANHWPALDFGRVTKIKRRLDFKAPRAHSDSSSSSDSEDETRKYVMTQKQDELVMSKLPTKVSPSMRPKPENHLPYPDLTKTELKKPLDIKAPSTDSDSSSASDSDDETKHYMTKQKQEELPILNVLANRSTESQKQANHWPTLDFGKVTKIKRRLDFKAPRAYSDSSSSSDSEDETRRYVMTQKQEELVMSKLPTKVSPTMRPKPENRWPYPDLAKTELKKPLDTKAPLTDSDSSSASDSDDETKYNMTKQKQEELPILNVLANRSTASQKQANLWPALDFGKVTKIKRRLDIKAPKAHSDSSSSSDSEDETRRYVKTQKQEELVMSKIPTKVSSTMRPKPENRWPPPDLAKTELKKPLNTKAPLTDSDSSSASDSNDETKYHMTKQKQEELPILNVLANRSTESQKQANHWPALDLGKVTKIKRRLHIKAPRAHSDSSSSSDSEDETRAYVMTQKQEELVMSKLPTKVSPTMRPKPENRWPPPDLEIKELKKPLDTKAPLTDSDSSSASDSDDETQYHMTKQKQVEPNIVNVSANRSTAISNKFSFCK